MRLNRYLSRCGLGSRRDCDKIVEAGLIAINGAVCKQLNFVVTEDDKVVYKSKALTPIDIEVVLWHKPKGCVCSKKSEQKIPSIYELLPKRLHHLSPVGRLDAATEGLLILTNDGDLAQQISSPKHGVQKEYLVTLNQAFEKDRLLPLLKGIYSKEEGKMKFDAVKRISARRMVVVLSQGKNRQIRRMFQTLGFRVEKLVRVRIGGLWDAELPLGSWRFLNQSDWQQVFNTEAELKGYITQESLVAKNKSDRSSSSTKKPAASDQRASRRGASFQERKEESRSNSRRSTGKQYKKRG